MQCNDSISITAQCVWFIMICTSLHLCRFWLAEAPVSGGSPPPTYLDCVCVDIVLPTQHPISAHVDRGPPPPHAGMGKKKKEKATVDLVQLIFTGCTFVLCQRAVGTERTWRNLPDNLGLSTPLCLLASFHSGLHESRCPSSSPQGLCRTQKFWLIYI